MRIASLLNLFVSTNNQPASLTWATTASIALLCVVCQLVHAAPPPPRGGAHPTRTAPLFVPDDQVDTIAPSARPALVAPKAEPYQPVPLSKIIAEHEKNQKISQAGVEALSLQEMTAVLKTDYLAHGSRSDKWDKSMLAAIDETLHCLEINATEPQRKKLMNMLRLPARYKSDDPRYYYMYVYARNYTVSTENIKALEKGLELAQKDIEHNRHLLWLMNLRLSQIQVSWGGKSQEAVTSRQRAREVFVLWLEHDLPRYDQNLIYDWSDYFNELMTPVGVTDQEEASVGLTMKKIDQLKNLEPWSKALLSALAARQWAWAVRGGGYATTVKDEAWSVWAEKNELAYRMAIKAHELNPHQALAATLLIELCWAQDESLGKLHSSRYWFEQAVAAMVDYQRAFIKYAFGIRPRWDGSIQMEFDFAWECALTRRYDTDIPFFTSRIILNILFDLDENKTPLKPHVSRQAYAIIEQVFQAILPMRKIREHASCFNSSGSAGQTGSICLTKPPKCAPSWTILTIRSSPLKVSISSGVSQLMSSTRCLPAASQAGTS